MKLSSKHSRALFVAIVSALSAPGCAERGDEEPAASDEAAQTASDSRGLTATMAANPRQMARNGLCVAAVDTLRVAGGVSPAAQSKINNVLGKDDELLLRFDAPETCGRITNHMTSRQQVLFNEAGVLSIQTNTTATNRAFASFLTSEVESYDLSTGERLTLANSLSKEGRERLKWGCVRASWVQPKLQCQGLVDSPASFSFAVTPSGFVLTQSVGTQASLDVEMIAHSYHVPFVEVLTANITNAALKKLSSQWLAQTP